MQSAGKILKNDLESMCDGKITVAMIPRDKTTRKEYDNTL